MFKTVIDDMIKIYTIYYILNKWVINSVQLVEPVEMFACQI
jgi:hypothetical protein